MKWGLVLVTSGPGAAWGVWGAWAWVPPHFDGGRVVVPMDIEDNPDAQLGAGSLAGAASKKEGPAGLRDDREAPPERRVREAVEANTAPEAREPDEARAGKGARPRSNGRSSLQDPILRWAPLASQLMLAEVDIWDRAPHVVLYLIIALLILVIVFLSVSLYRNSAHEPDYSYDPEERHRVGGGDMSVEVRHGVRATPSPHPHAGRATSGAAVHAGRATRQSAVDIARHISVARGGGPTIPTRAYGGSMAGSLKRGTVGGATRPGGYDEVEEEEPDDNSSTNGNVQPDANSAL